MRKTHPFGTLDSRIYTIFTLMIFAAIFIMQLISFRFTLNTVRRSTLDNNRVMLEQLVSQIDSYITGMEPLVQAVLKDEEVQALFALPEDRTALMAREEDARKIRNRLGNYTRTRDDISDIMVLGDNGLIIASESEAQINPWTSVEEKDWFSGARNVFDKTVVSSSYVQNLIKDRYSWVVSLSRAILSQEDRSILGVLLVDLKFMRINELCRTLSVGNGVITLFWTRGGIMCSIPPSSSFIPA